MNYCCQTKGSHEQTSDTPETELFVVKENNIQQENDENEKEPLLNTSRP